MRTANAIDPTSRTLLVEIAVDNPTGQLFTGSYAEVHFKLPTPEEYIEADALEQAADIVRYEKLSEAEAAAEVVKRGHVESLKQWFVEEGPVS